MSDQIAIHTAAASETAQTTPLQPFYYLDNFHTLLNCVEAQYANLLSAEESAYIRGFRKLSRTQQALLVRLYGRKGPLFRCDKLAYAEIPHLNDDLDVLASAGWIEFNPDAEASTLLALLTKEEIRQGWRADAPRSSKRDMLLENLELACADIYQHDAYRFLQLNHTELVLLFRLLFFGNLYQDLTTFVTSDLGVIRYETYQLDPEHRLFATREDIDRIKQLVALADEYASLESLSSQICADIIAKTPAPGDNAALRRRHDRFCNKIARDLERLQDLDLAYQVYQRTEAPPSRERRARILFKQEKYAEARDLCAAIIDAPHTEAELIFAEQFRDKCIKVLGHTMPRSKPFRPAQRSLTIAAHPELRVEELVRQEVATEGGVCAYVENWLFNAVFGLTFWPAVFAPVAGAFSHPYQHRPHDLYDAGFTKKRSVLIQTAFALIDSEEWVNVVIGRWREKFGLSNPFVGWPEAGEDCISLALERIPREHWRAVFQRMLRDLRENGSGFPDLIHFPEQGGYELLEVKSPTDSLQPNQKRWMATFEKNDIPYQLVQVTWL
ncbi:conserved hypothetical protein [Hahella chejuensis KCTC 2396]|uniref:phosphodiesterase I n=1 Tax=Hahella chejuensis (strain KCTC 2396) TaxID=349521 RepID=Q2SNJ9_HAHCH|nr:VRR-NUC domain-containing protein [Hahella chejuensis]ABC27775.1 conserved hypothetical protein [Hahella chejuensis KCTC 2396]